MMTPKQESPVDQIELKRRLDFHLRAGYQPANSGQSSAKCDQWLQAWKIIKQLTTPDIRDSAAFDRRFPNLWERVFNWCQDFEMELGNAGVDAPIYHEQRVRYVREFLDIFPDEIPSIYLNHRRAEAEALWALGRIEEAEAVFQALVEHMPDEAWAHIGWADQHWLLRDDSTRDYARAEAMMLNALRRPNLQDRGDVLDRLADLYDACGRQTDRDAVLAEAKALQPLVAPLPSVAVPSSPDPAPQKLTAAQFARKLGRNEPCWCGSGKKYKHCHLSSDQRS